MCEQAILLSALRIASDLFKTSYLKYSKICDGYQNPKLLQIKAGFRVILIAPQDLN